MKKLILVLFLFPFVSLGQENRHLIDSLFISKIPFNSDSAVNDIKNGKIRIIKLLSDSVLEDPYSESDDIDYVENKYGFMFYYQEFNVPDNYLKLKETEYNQVVFEYLDQLCSCDSKKEIYSDLRSRFLEKHGKFRETNKKSP